MGFVKAPAYLGMVCWTADSVPKYCRHPSFAGESKDQSSSDCLF